MRQPKRPGKGAPWIRLPTYIARDLIEGERSTDAQAFARLLLCWHEDYDIGPNEFMRRCGWGKGRTLRFMLDVAAWAVENGAAVPASWVDRVADRSRDRLRTGSGEEQPAQSEASGPVADHFRTDSRARDLFSGGEEKEIMIIPSGEEARLPADPESTDPEPEANPDADRTPKAPKVNPDVLTVWEAWRAFHPSAKAIPNKAATREIKAALGEADAAALVSLVEWAHLAPGQRASFLRGRAYEAGESSVGDFLGVENLMRRANLASRVAWAAEWQAAGRPDYRDAPAPVENGNGRTPTLTEKDQRVLDTLRAFALGTHVTKHPDPEYAQKVLDVWLLAGAGPAGAAHIEGQWLDRWLREQLGHIRNWQRHNAKGVTRG